MRFRLRTLLVLLGILPPLLAYVPGYFLMGEAYPSWYTDSSPSSRKVYRVVRRYPHRWQKSIFRPAGKLEAWLCEKEVYIELPANVEIRDLASLELKKFREAIRRYTNDVGVLPPNLEALLQVPPALSDKGTWKGPYLDSKELWFKWESLYDYEVVDERTAKFRISYSGLSGPINTIDEVALPVGR